MRVLVRLLVSIGSLVAGVAAAAFHVGCSSSPAPPTPTTVRGRITFQGQPLAGGTVVFAPDPDRGTAGKPVRGDTGPDGTFQLAVDGRPNVPPGWYRVAIAPPADASGTHSSADPGAPPGAPVFPPALRRPDRSKLIREVTAGKDHVFEFAVEVPSG